MPRTMNRAHTSCHDRRTIGHANWIGHIELVPARSSCRNGIYVWCSYNPIPITPQMIGTMLIRYYEQKVWFFPLLSFFEAICHAQFQQVFKGLYMLLTITQMRWNFFAVGFELLLIPIADKNSRRFFVGGHGVNCSRA